MANLEPKKIVLSEINNGKQFEEGDGIQPNAINAPIQASAYAQALATNAPNLSNIDSFGTPKVSIEEVGGLPRLKFENLKSVGIESIVQTKSPTQSSGQNVIEVTLNNGVKQQFSFYNGATGAKLVSRVLQGQDENGGNIYLDTFDDGTTAIFTVPKGEDGHTPTIQDWLGYEQLGSPTNPLYYDGEKFVASSLVPREITLENSEWEFIDRVSREGKASEYFRIGEQKKVVLNNGTVLYFSIIGFNHDVYYGATNNKIGITFSIVDFYSVIGTVGDTNYEDECKTFYSTLPLDLQAVIKNTYKKYTKTLGTSYDYEEKVFIPSQKEVFGISGNSSESQYEFWLNGGSTIKYRDLNAAKWVLRVSYEGDVRPYVDEYGELKHSDSPHTGGNLCFCFCI